MKFSNYFLLILSVVFISCASNKNTALADSNSVFSKEETKLILSGDPDQPMRVLLITNPKDSVILRSKSTDFVVKENDFNFYRNSQKDYIKPYGTVRAEVLELLLHRLEFLKRSYGYSDLIKKMNHLRYIIIQESQNILI